MNTTMNNPTSCSGCQVHKDGPTLIFSCSGAADLGGVADQAARKLNAEGMGKMFCLSAIGGGIQSYLEATDKAGKILVMDGCPVACGKHTLEEAGFTDFAHLLVTSLGLEKGKTGITPEAVERVAQAGRKILTQSNEV